MKHITLCIALALAASARAEPAPQLGVHLVSWHARPGYEWATGGLYWRAPSGLTLGALRNSEGRASAYLAHTWQTSDRRWALTVGGIAGYRGATVSPLLVPSWRQELGAGAALRLADIPKPRREGGSSALHLAVEFDF